MIKRRTLWHTFFYEQTSNAPKIG